MAILSISELRKAFGGVWAIDGCTIALKEASITGLIGPNGAGKTTLFNLVTGLLRPDSGALIFRGSRIDGLPPHRIFRSGLVRTFQIPRHFPGMSVLENLMLVPSGQHGENVWKAWFWNNVVSRQEDDIRRRAESVLELVALTPLRFHDPMQLSGGQKKLLELARSLMSDPHMVLLDEPSAGVNPALAKQLFDHIRSIRDQRGVTFLLIEHDMAAIARVCDWVIVMAEGRVLMEGTPDEVRNDDRVLEAYLGRQALATG